MLRGELLERGWDAQYAPSLRAAVGHMTRGAARTPVEVLFVDGQALTDDEQPLLRSLVAIDGKLALVLLAGPSDATPTAPWQRVVRRPIDVPKIAEHLRQVHAARAKAPVVDPGPHAFRLRRGDPWPSIACDRCHVARHFQLPGTTERVAGVRAEMIGFALEHAVCVLR